jgi:hypothetical protein
MANRMAGRVSVKGNLSDEQYYKGWPNKSPYNDDIKWACQISIQYLQKIAPKYKNSGKIGLVIFDIDDTLCMGDPANVIGVREMEMGTHKGPDGDEQDVFILPMNNPVVKVAKVARQLGFKIVALTARPQESRLASVTNLNMFNVPYDMIIMNNKEEDPHFKIRIRNQLQKPGQDIVMTVGDQPMDVYLPGNSAAIKLPDPELKCSYAYIP